MTSHRISFSRLQKRPLNSDKNTQFLSELDDSPNYQYNDLNLGVNEVCLCSQYLSALGGLSELSVPELTDLYCSITNVTCNHTISGVP